VVVGKKGVNDPIHSPGHTAGGQRVRPGRTAR
jgi:hypothetical protein